MHIGGSARVISADVRHPASQRQRRYLRDDLGPALTRPATPPPRRQARAASRAA